MPRQTRRLPALDPNFASLPSRAPHVRNAASRAALSAALSTAPSLMPPPPVPSQALEPLAQTLVTQAAPPQPPPSAPTLVDRVRELETQLNTVLMSLQRNHQPASPLCVALLTASESLTKAHRRILRLVDHFNPPTAQLLSIAKLCLTGPVGRVMHRRAMRALANMLLDSILNEDPNNVEALCVKGESLLPPIFYGRSHPYTPRSILREAYLYFERAANNGSALGSFLKGRWLLSMEVLHKDPEKADSGRRCIDLAANEQCSRSLTFLAHRYEYPHLDSSINFSKNVPKGKLQREKYIVGVYLKAAEKGDADALNDIGTSYAEGYGGLMENFDYAVTYYQMSIRQGGIHAYDNLGTHYETGMGGKCRDRIDYRKALFYYRQGVKKRCPRCAFNLGAAHEEGMSDVLERNPHRAERYYRYAIRLADDCNDAATAARSLKELVALYLTRIKLDPPDGEVGAEAARRLMAYVGNQDAIDRVMGKMNQAILAASRNKGKCPGLKRIVGDVNAKKIVERMLALEKRLEQTKDPVDAAALQHVLGTPTGTFEDTDAGVRNRRRPSSALPPSGARKRKRRI